MNPNQTIRYVLNVLEAEHARVTRQITAVRSALNGDAIAEREPQPRKLPRRQRWSKAARVAVSKRMKAYWRKKRRAA